MKQIKLSGRERAVLRYIDWTSGTSGEDLLELTKLEPDDLVGVLNGLISVGYVEMIPFAEETNEESFRGQTFEVNPSYALELRSAMKM